MQNTSPCVGKIKKYLRRKRGGRALLNRLKARPDVITWDKTGRVKIEGETTTGSNISDLVSDAMRSTKNFNPEGSKEFFEALTKINVPKDFGKKSGAMEKDG